MGISFGFRPNIKCTVLQSTCIVRSRNWKCVCALSVCVQGRVLYVLLFYLFSWSSCFNEMEAKLWGCTRREEELQGGKEIITHFPVPSTLATHSGIRGALHLSPSLVGHICTVLRVWCHYKIWVILSRKLLTKPCALKWHIMANYQFTRVTEMWKDLQFGGWLDSSSWAGDSSLHSCLIMFYICLDWGIKLF